MSALQELYWIFLFIGIIFMLFIFYIGFVYEPRQVKKYKKLLNQK